MTASRHIPRLRAQDEAKEPKPKETVCPDLFDEKDPEDEKRIRKARRNSAFIGIFFIILGGASAYLGYTIMPSDQLLTGGFLSNALFLGGLVTLFFGGATLITAVSPIKQPDPVKITTELRCRKCDYKATRDFKSGDYIFSEADPCLKCQAPTYIWGIYSDPPKSKEEKEIELEDL